MEAGGRVSQAMQAFRTFLGENDMLAYLAMMAPRLMELRRAMKASAGIYLHCDPSNWVAVLHNVLCVKNSLTTRAFRFGLFFERGILLRASSRIAASGGRRLSVTLVSFAGG